MKLTKAKLIKQTKNELSKLGYHEIKDTITVAEGLYVKLIKKDLFITLGLTISRYYEARFTASFYLSKTTIWGAIWGDIPKDSYQRVAHFLTREERQVFLSNEYSKDDIIDAWWDVSNSAIANFVYTVKITEKRFLEQPDLLNKIESSLEVKELQELSAQVIEERNSDKHDQFIYNFIPKKPIDDIPIRWFKTAERVLFFNNAIVNTNTVKRLAADAWRQSYILDHFVSSK